MSEDEQDEFAGLSDEDRRLHQLIVKERTLDFTPKPGEPRELARLRANSSTGAVQLEPGDERFFVVRELGPDEIRRARKKILSRHYLEEGKEAATAKIDQAFGLFPSEENTQNRWKDELLGIITFNVATPAVQDCCGKTNAGRVWVCGRLYVFRGQPDGCTGLLLRQALVLQKRDIVVSYADTAQGHTGGVYKNNGFTYRDSGSLTTQRRDWQDLRNPRLDGQTVARRRKREWAANTFDPANYCQVERSVKHCWVWFRNPADEALCRWPATEPPTTYNRDTIHPDTYADTAAPPPSQLPVPATARATYILHAELGSDDADDANSAHAIEKYELATAIMRRVSTWKANTYGGRPQPCVVSEIRGAWYRVNRERWTGEQVSAMAHDLCAYGYLDQVLLGVSEFTVIVGAKPFPYPGIRTFSESKDGVKDMRRVINDRYANDSTAKKMAEKIREIQKAMDKAHEDRDQTGVEQLERELAEQQDVLRIFTQRAYSTGVPRHLHSVSVALFDYPPASRRRS